MGTLIRKFTGEKYNHVSLSLDEHLRILYSFARKYSNTPFYGGFVKETARRFKYKNKSSTIKICAVPVDKAQKSALCSYLFERNRNSNKYLYNMISAIFTPIHKKIKIDNAYTCIEFVVDALVECGISEEINKENFYSLSDLQEKYNMYTVYEGAFLNHEAEAQNSTDNFLMKKNFAIRTYITLGANIQLIQLLLKSHIIK